jgi:hypothetical protein
VRATNRGAKNVFINRPNHHEAAKPCAYDARGTLPFNPMA